VTILVIMAIAAMTVDSYSKYNNLRIVEKWQPLQTIAITTPYTQELHNHTTTANYYDHSHKEKAVLSLPSLTSGFHTCNLLCSKSLSDYHLTNLSLLNVLSA